jgi:hypothetical protein
MGFLRRRFPNAARNFEVPPPNDVEADTITERALLGWRQQSFESLRLHAGRPWTSWEVDSAGAGYTLAVVVRSTDDPEVLCITIGAGPLGAYPEASRCRSWTVCANGDWTEQPTKDVDWTTEHPRGLELEALGIANEALRDFSSQPYATINHWANHGFHASSVKGLSGVAYSRDVTACWDDGPGSPVDVHLEVSAELAEDHWSEPLAFAAFVKHRSGEVELAEAWSLQEDGHDALEGS